MKSARQYSTYGSKMNYQHKNKMEKQRRYAQMLAAVVIMFFICHSFRVVAISFDIWMYEMNAFCQEFGERPTYPIWLYVIVTINHYLATVNSSGNFLIYTFIGSKFRRILKKTFSFRRDSNTTIELMEVN